MDIQLRETTAPQKGDSNRSQVTGYLLNLTYVF